MAHDHAENQRRLEQHLAYCREVFVTEEVGQAWIGIRKHTRADPASTQRFGPRRSAGHVPVQEASTADLLTVLEAADYLRVSVSALRRLQQGRHIAFIKIGGSLRFARTDLSAYVAKQRVLAIENR